MNTTNKILGAGFLLVVPLGSPLFAGPPTEFWNRARPIANVKEAAALKDDATVAMVCAGCKTVMIREARAMGPPSKSREEWFTIGSEHKCDHCGGTIKVVKGKTADTMEHNCSKCGDHAAFCCAVPPAKGKR